jgi:hypothetical protein
MKATSAGPDSSGMTSRLNGVPCSPGQRMTRKARSWALASFVLDLGYALA